MPNTAEAISYPLEATIDRLCNPLNNKYSMPQEKSTTKEPISFEAGKKVEPLSVIDSDDLKRRVTNSNSNRVVETKLKLDDEFRCVVSHIDTDLGILDARVYDMKDNVHVMEIELEFSEFEPDDQTLIKLGAIFYWRIGKQTELIENKKKKLSRRSTNFSSFKMRRVYTSSRFHRTTIKAKSQKFESVFID